MLTLKEMRDVAKWTLNGMPKLGFLTTESKIINSREIKFRNVQRVKPSNIKLRLLNQLNCSNIKIMQSDLQVEQGSDFNGN